jgi:hypothetical protein
VDDIGGPTATWYFVPTFELPPLSPVPKVAVYFPQLNLFSVILTSNPCPINVQPAGAIGQHIGGDSADQRLAS